MLNSPVVGNFNPASKYNNVVLPQPEGPRIDQVSPRKMFQLKFWKSGE
jgi:hypothetical protein